MLINNPSVFSFARSSSSPYLHLSDDDNDGIPTSIAGVEIKEKYSRICIYFVRLKKIQL